MSRTSTLTRPCKRSARLIYGLILRFRFSRTVLVVEMCDIFLSRSQMDVAGNRKAVVINVPYRLRKAFRKIHVRLVRELEKKFSGKVGELLVDLLDPFFLRV